MHRLWTLPDALLYHELMPEPGGEGSQAETAVTPQDLIDGDAGHGEKQGGQVALSGEYQPGHDYADASPDAIPADSKPADSEPADSDGSLADEEQRQDVIAQFASQENLNEEQKEALLQAAYKELHQANVLIELVEDQLAGEHPIKSVAATKKLIEQLRASLDILGQYGRLADKLGFSSHTRDLVDNSLARVSEQKQKLEDAALSLLSKFEEGGDLGDLGNASTKEEVDNAIEELGPKAREKWRQILPVLEDLGGVSLEWFLSSAGNSSVNRFMQFVLFGTDGSHPALSGVTHELGAEGGGDVLQHDEFMSKFKNPKEFAEVLHRVYHQSGGLREGGWQLTGELEEKFQKAVSGGDQDALAAILTDLYKSYLASGSVEQQKERWSLFRTVVAKEISQKEGARLSDDSLAFLRDGAENNEKFTTVWSS